MSKILASLKLDTFDILWHSVRSCNAERGAFRTGRSFGNGDVCGIPPRAFYPLDCGVSYFLLPGFRMICRSHSPVVEFVVVVDQIFLEYLSPPVCTRTELLLTPLSGFRHNPNLSNPRPFTFQDTEALSPCGIVSNRVRMRFAHSPTAA